jgi:transmembrane sensor
MNDRARLEAAADWLQRLQSAPQDETVLGQWLDWCQEEPQNLQAFERMQEIWQAFDRPRRKERARLSRFAVAAGLAVLAMLAGWQLWSHYERRSHTLTTDVAQHGSQILSDGSQVDLGARTRIVTRYNDRQRNVTVESGEAFFEVAKDVARPFVVRAGAVRITALGTAFSVRRTLDRTVVTVSEGLVSVTPGTTTPGHELRAGVGERVTFSSNANRLSVSNVDPKAATAWRQGVLRFVDEPLAAVVDDVNRYSTQPIKLASSHLGERLYTGTVYRDRINDWLGALERVFPLDAVEDSSGAVTLVAK